MLAPLFENQLEALDQTIDPKARPFRILADGCAMNICTGVTSSKGSNIMYHPVYWDRPKKFINQVLEYVKKNNPGVKFRITYH